MKVLEGPGWSFRPLNPCNALRSLPAFRPFRSPESLQQTLRVPSGLLVLPHLNTCNTLRTLSASRSRKSSRSSGSVAPVFECFT
ncbi:hypothetical protein CW304_27420 [Bacillus sp. UFRGS-B20]|nr:hypothetical protein CW304_27420 [Bacillus sp. UFRGS-B20]